MPKQRRPWTKAEQQRETQAIRDKVDLRDHAERLGYVQVSGSGARVRMENKALDKADPMREITLKPNSRGEPSWVTTKAGKGSGLASKRRRHRELERRRHVGAGRVYPRLGR